jgi:hypothetical protein
MFVVAHTVSQNALNDHVDAPALENSVAVEVARPTLYVRKETAAVCIYADLFACPTCYCLIIIQWYDDPRVRYYCWFCRTDRLRPT